MVKPRSYPLPDFGDVIFLLVVNFLLFGKSSFLFADGSTGWHLVAGQYILSNHSIPHQDLISYTFPGAPWVAYEWLFDLFAAAIAGLSGLNGLAVAVTAIIAVVSLLLYERCRKRGANFFLAAFLILVGTLASSIHWLARPHIFSFLGVYIFSVTLESFHRGEIGKKRLLATLGPCMVLWANLHPGFLYGFALVIIYLICELAAVLVQKSATASGDAPARAKACGLALVLLLVASLATPYGTQLWVYIANYLQGGQVIQVTNEYQSPTFHGAPQSVCLELVFLCLILGLAFTKKIPSLPQLVSTLVFGHLALASLRSIPEFVVVALPFIAELSGSLRFPFAGHDSPGEAASWLKAMGTRLDSFNQRFDQTESTCRMHLLPIAAVVILFGVAMNGGSLLGQTVLTCGFSKQTFPTSTLDCIRDKNLPPKEGFNFDNWGGYIRYRLGIPVFIDDRLDFYGQKFYQEYGRVVELNPGWSNILDRNHISWILMPKNAQLCSQLSKDSTWKLVCDDEAANLFQKTTK